MKLFINTTSNKKTVLRFGDKTIEKDSSVWHSQVLLPMISTLKTEDISEIVVETGEGSLTGIRVGVAVAQALGFALKIPVSLTSPIL